MRVSLHLTAVLLATLGCISASGGRGHDYDTQDARTVDPLQEHQFFGVRRLVHDPHLDTPGKAQRYLSFAIERDFQTLVARDDADAKVWAHRANVTLTPGAVYVTDSQVHVLAVEGGAVGFMAFDASTGSPLATHWLGMTCTKHEQRRGEWRVLHTPEPHWLASLRPGDPLDVYIPSLGRWTPARATSVHTHAHLLTVEVLMVVANPSGAVPKADLNPAVWCSTIDYNCTGTIASFRSMTQHWVSVLAPGDYLEARSLPSPHTESGGGVDTAHGVWSVQRIDDVLHAHEEGNTYGRDLARIGNEWVVLPDEGVKGEVGRETNVEPCGTHTHFSDMPQVVALGTLALYTVTQQLPGLGHQVVALERGTLTVKWSRELQCMASETFRVRESTAPHQPPSDGAMVYVTCLASPTTERLFAFAAETGDELWRHDVRAQNHQSQAQSAARRAFIAVGDRSTLMYDSEHSTFVEIDRAGVLVEVVSREGSPVAGGSAGSGSSGGDGAGTSTGRGIGTANSPDGRESWEMVFLDVPRRTQHGPTCGLNALSMVLSYWRQQQQQQPQEQSRNMSLPTPILVGDEVTALSPLSQRLLTKGVPRERERRSLLASAQARGYTALGEAFNATQLAALASSLTGFAGAVHCSSATSIDTLLQILDAGKPAIVPFDVTDDGEPGEAGGDRAHYAVISGYLRRRSPKDEHGNSEGEDSLVLIALHSWNTQYRHLWHSSDFLASWKQLESTSFYGIPGDGAIPASVLTENQGGLREPSRMALRSASGLRALTLDSLAGAIVEVVPSWMPLHGLLVEDEGESPVTRHSPSLGGASPY